MFQTRIIPNKPILVLEGSKKYLVITDIHIGFEGSMSSNKVFIGKNSSINETIQDLTEIIEDEKPNAVIILGDVKSSIKNISKNEWDEVPLFFDKIGQKCEVVLIPGNHDANIQRLVPDNVSMISSAGMIEEDILFTHGHTMPSEKFSEVNRIVMGHIHPVFFEEDSLINGQRVWITLKIKKEDIFPNRKGELDIVIVPSFNKYFYATFKKKYKKSISPIIDKIENILAAKIITLEGAIIGNETKIKQII